jgi:hypothetical protein
MNTSKAGARGRRVAFTSGALAGAALLLALAGGPLLGSQAPPADTPPAAADKPAAHADVLDTTACATCHESAVRGSRGTPHASLEQSCGSCHGDVAGHLKSVTESGEVGPITKLKEAKPAEVTKACLTCHEKGHQRTFAGSVHDRRDVACTSCHSVHSFESVRSQLKTARDAETCFQCARESSPAATATIPTRGRSPRC